ncbi:MAG: class I SAM-dependent methyltransferase, partial [Chloroflexi bacterium]|nr:class I SAM-dependent methyltransferase [Chloroflexota bacterium]
MTHAHGAAEEHLRRDPGSELWGEHRARYGFARTYTAGRRTLDVACGAGFGLEMLVDAGARAIGIDLGATALAEARRARPDVQLVRSDALRLPLADASVEAVVSMETIEHVPDAARLVSEFRRVLVPGGTLVMSTPNRAFGPERLHTDNPFHVREFTAAELGALLRTSFAEVCIYGQRVSAAYRFVPFLMVEPEYTPSALAWKLMHRL